MLTALQEAGLEINQARKDYITVKDPESREKLSLKGGIYAEHWNLELAGQAHESQGRAGTAGNGSPDTATIRRLKQELEQVVQSRAQYNQDRYPTPARQLGAERDFTLPDTKRRLWLEVPANPGLDPVYPDGRNIKRLGPDDPGRKEDYDLASGDNHALGTERSLGGAERQDIVHLQGIGAVPRPDRQGLPADVRGLDDHPRGNNRQTRRLENSEEIGHDRIGTYLEKYPAYPGARLERHAESPRHIPSQPSTQPGELRSGHPPASGENRSTPDRATGIRTALATLERYTRELGTALVMLERLVEPR